MWIPDKEGLLRGISLFREDGALFIFGRNSGGMSFKAHTLENILLVLLGIYPYDRCRTNTCKAPIR